MNEIQESIIDRVKKNLEISEDINAFDLHKILYNTRNNSHPDLFEENLKKTAQERFQELSVYLSELKTFLDNLKLTKSPQELIIYEKSFESVIDKSRIIELEGKNKKLEESLSYNKIEIENLKKTIEKLQEKKSEDLNTELNILYKPKSSNFLVLGISTFLILLVNILAQIKSLKEGLLNVFPFGIQILNYFLFTLLIIIIIKLFINNQKYHKIQKFSEELKSSTQIDKFYNYYKKEREDYPWQKEYFTEKNVEEFLNWHILRRKYQKSFAYHIESITHIGDKKSHNYLRDIFIYNLITKGFIKIGSAKKLDREFLIE
jgi:hypothetical protein